MTHHHQSIVDMTHARNRLRYNSAYRLVSFGGPTLGPLIGAFVVSRADWRWNLRILPIFSGIILVIYAFTVPESHRATIARKQAARREREMVAEEDGDDMEKGLGMKPSALNKRQLPGPTLAQRYKVALMRPFIFIFTGQYCPFTSLLVFI